MVTPANIIAEARTWVDGWDFIEIESIAWVPDNGAAGLWWPPWEAKGQTKARITLGWDQPAELLYHEVFHSVATKAPLIRVEPLWGEGWCSAFAAIVQNVYEADCPCVEPGPDNPHRLYGFATMVLARHVNRSLAALKSLWLDFNAQARAGVLPPKAFSQFVGYDPELGRYIPVRR